MFDWINKLFGWPTKAEKAEMERKAALARDERMKQSLAHLASISVDNAKQTRRRSKARTTYGSAAKGQPSPSVTDDILSNPLHPLNPISPLNHIYHDSTPSHADTCSSSRHDSDYSSSSYSSSYSSSSHDSGSSYDSGSSCSSSSSFD